MVSFFACLAAPLLAAVPAMAQMTATAQLVTGSLTAGTSFAPLPNGAALGSSYSNGCAASCGTSSLAGGQAGTLEHFDLGWVASCQANTTGTTVAEATIRYDFSSPVAFVGQIVVTWNATNGGTGASLLEIDLGVDGTIDATGATTLPVAFGPGTKSLQLRIRSQAVAGVMTGPFGSSYPYQGNANATALLRLEPTHCQSQVVGATCGLPQFGITNNFFHGVKLQGPIRAFDEISFLVLGLAPASLPIPLPTTCVLQVDPAILLWYLPEIGEVPAWSLTLPPAMLPVTFRAQHFGIDLANWSVAGSVPLQLVWQ